VLAAVGIIGMVASAIVLLASTSEGDPTQASTLAGVGYVGLFLSTVISMRVVALVVRDRSP
jgi:hypothetical protein